MANPNIVSVATIEGGNLGWNLTNTLTTQLLTVASEYVVKINRIVCTNIHATDAANLNLYVDGLGNGSSWIYWYHRRCNCLFSKSYFSTS